MKYFLRSTFAFFLIFSIATPSVAYFSTNESRPTRRTVSVRAQKQNRVSNVSAERRTRNRAVSRSNDGRRLLRRATGRSLRRSNRTAKPNSDRYRTLNVRRNKRRIRSLGKEANLALPHTLVQTGTYDRPTRRDIVGGLERLH